MSADRIAQIKANAAAAKAAAEQIDVSQTEQVTVGDLTEGDVITRLGNAAFDFPFTISKVQNLGPHGIMLVAAHGWISIQERGGALSPSESVTRVL